MPASSSPSPRKRANNKNEEAAEHVKIRCKSSRSPAITIPCPLSVTKLSDLKHILYDETGIAPHRQRLVFHHGSTTYGSLMLDADHATVLHDDHKTLHEYKIESGNVLYLKDLGPQIPWRTVFIVEYLGPLLIHQLFVAWLGVGSLSGVQLAAWAMVSGHYLKRLWESIFVHRFSHETMPLSGCIKNCVHYWVVGGVLLAYSVYCSSYGRPAKLSIRDGLCVIAFALCESGNLYSHLKLKWLRPEGTKKRGIPTGFPFSQISCPNYFFELLSWISYACMVRTPIAWFFACSGGVQMWLWAKKKHAAYLREFSDYPSNRKPMIPFLL